MALSSVILAALLALTPAAAPPDRGAEVLRLNCASDVGRREITLFGNGTVRLREGWVGYAGGEVVDLGLPASANPGTLRLGQMTPEELAATLSRLRREDLAETPESLGGLGGEWVERCLLVVELAGEERREFSFGRYDSLTLALSRVVRLAEGLEVYVEETLSEAGPAGEAGDGARPRLPDGYRPAAGDVLQRWDGELYEVLRFTDDNRGVELQGVSQPVTLFVAKEDLRGEFILLVRRRGER